MAAPVETALKNLAVLALAALLALVAQTGSYAQAYPDRPIRLVVPFAPGGTNDIVARVSGVKLAEYLGQSVLVENRAGANAVIGTESVARAEPDGYTLLMVNINFAINPAMNLKLPYDALRDFSPISMLAVSPVILVAAPSSPIGSVKQLIAYARENPGRLNYATSSAGSNTHVPMELLSSMTKLDMVPIHYKGGGPAMVDLLAARIPVGFGTMLSVLPYIKANRLRALAVSTSTRSAALPNVPTVAEAGVPGYDYAGWWGIVAPAKTPQPIIDRLSLAFREVQHQPFMRDRLSGEGAEPRTSTPEEFARFLADETGKWGKVAKATNLRND